MDLKNKNKTKNPSTGTIVGSVVKIPSPMVMPEEGGIRSAQGSASSGPISTVEVVGMASTLEGCHLSARKKKRSGAERRRRAKGRVDLGSAPGTMERCGGGGAAAVSRKRTGPGAATPPSVGGRHPKRARVLSPCPGGAAPALRKVAVVKEGYPGSDLLDGDIVIIQGEILRRVDEIPIGNPLPLLDNFSLMGGILTYYCEDEFSTGWLKESLRGFKIKGTGIRAMDPSDLPKPVRVAFKTKDMSTKEAPKLLRRLGAYNSALRTECWRVLQRTEDVHTQRWIFLVDRKSADAIEAAQFRAHTGVDKGTFKFLDKPSTGGAGTSGMECGGESEGVSEEKKVGEECENAPNPDHSPSEGMVETISRDEGQEGGTGLLDCESSGSEDLDRSTEEKLLKDDHQLDDRPDAV